MNHSPTASVSKLRIIVTDVIKDAYNLLNEICLSRSYISARRYETYCHLLWPQYIVTIILGANYNASAFLHRRLARRVTVGRFSHPLTHQHFALLPPLSFSVSLPLFADVITFFRASLPQLNRVGV